MVGPGEEKDTQTGPLIDFAAVARVDRIVEDSASYAKVTVRGGPITDGPLSSGADYRLSLIEVEDVEAPIIQQEVFAAGPTISRMIQQRERLRTAAPCETASMVNTADGYHFHFDPDNYLDTIRAEMPAYDELQDAVAEATAGIHAGRVLELGVGTGETSRRVLDRHPEAELVGIDESAGMLAVASAEIAADLRVSRLQDPLPEGNFDLVVSALAVHHLDGAGKADLFARIAARLRPGGRFVLGDVVVPDDPADSITPINGVHDQPSTVDDQVRWLAAAGLDAEVVWARRDLAVIIADSPS